MHSSTKMPAAQHLAGRRGRTRLRALGVARVSAHRGAGDRDARARAGGDPVGAVARLLLGPGSPRGLLSGRLVRPGSKQRTTLRRDNVRVTGWALLTDEPVARVEVLVDGGFAGARLGLQRPRKFNLDVPSRRRSAASTSGCFRRWSRRRTTGSRSSRWSPASAAPRSCLRPRTRCGCARRSCRRA